MVIGANRYGGVKAVVRCLALLAGLMVLSLGAIAGAQDKWSLWTGPTQLRGANIYQRRVYPELDGRTFLGPGPFGPPYTQRDFDRLATLGANYVNISHPGLFTENPPYRLDPAAQANLDRLLGMAEAAGLYAVISFRTGPGRSEFTFMLGDLGDWFTEEYLNDSVWGDPRAQAAWAEMWKYTAQRYSGSSVVVGYDLMVEPNSNEVGSDFIHERLDIWDPEEFYARYSGSLYDWNQFYPAIVAAIREVDRETPILVGAMAYSAVDWLPYLIPTADPRTVYTVHQYAPFVYTHQEPYAQGYTYPGRFDTDWDGTPDDFDRDWLEGLLSTVDEFVSLHRVPVAVNEFGVVRWAPGADKFLEDQIALFEARGLNWALWAWEPSWRPWEREVTAFNFRLGPDPTSRDQVDSPLFQVIRAAWARNRIKP